MDNQSSQSSSGFEDRIRQMVDKGSRPVVRLPQMASQQTQPQPPYAAQHHNITPAAPTPTGPVQQSRFLPPHLQNGGNRQHAVSSHAQNQHQPHSGSFRGRGGPYRGNAMPRQQRSQHIHLDPNAYSRAGHHAARPALFDPNVRHVAQQSSWSDMHRLQAQYLDRIISREIPKVSMSQAERDEKEQFRQALMKLCDEVCKANPKLPNVKLECFGSFASGFASAGSDMDLVIVVESGVSAEFSLLEDDLPRALEKALLQKGHGAHLLTRTRVPIIKVCQSPPSTLLDNLRTEREKWDSLPDEKKYPHLFPDGDDDVENDLPQTSEVIRVNETTTVITKNPQGVDGAAQFPQKSEQGSATHIEEADNATLKQIPPTTGIEPALNEQPSMQRREQQTKTWTRERKAGPLDFPKDGAGIQCDINFFNPLGLHNTQMLRCYSICDPRVTPMVQFIKSWAKLRRINSSYSGTLSSYGYVLMALHFLMNVTQPPVLPNLQLQWRPDPSCTPPGATKVEVDGWIVDFWRNENEIQAALQSGQMSANRESLGSLLAAFFQYYSSMGRGPQFSWTKQVLSLRTQGGILTKEQKGWVKATTEESDGKRIQHRYLFCIEDPFELTHNVARTVTHNGIVAIRDEFRRAHRILHAIGLGSYSNEGDVFSQLVEPGETSGKEEDQALSSQMAGLKVVDATRPRSQEQQQQQQQRYQASVPHQKGANEGASRLPKNRLPQAQAKQFNVADQDAFPTLGSPATEKNRNTKKNNMDGSISGSKAQAYLEEVRRKKAEAQAEETASSAVQFLGL